MSCAICEQPFDTYNPKCPNEHHAEWALEGKHKHQQEQPVGSNVLVYTGARPLADQIGLRNRMLIAIRDYLRSLSTEPRVKKRIKAEAAIMANSIDALLAGAPEATGLLYEEAVGTYYGIRVAMCSPVVEKAVKANGIILGSGDTG